MKGIILAGGAGTRLAPITQAVSKQLIPIFDKPMIYYPLSTLIEAGINDILIISTTHQIDQFRSLLGDGSQWGCRFNYAEQAAPNGLAEAFIIGEEFIGDDKVALILGDNLFFGSDMGRLIRSQTDPDGGVVFAARVVDPERYGVVEFNDQMEAVSIEEKPSHPKSNYAVSGIYFYDNSVVSIAKQLTPSPRGELEITDVNNHYLHNGKLKVGVFKRGSVWLDTGTFDSMMSASQYVQVVEERQGIKIGCVEEAALNAGFINVEQLTELAKPLMKSGYGQYLLRIAQEYKAS
jgi:glucose-1-phosphate thymidylyltransferase